MKKQLIVRTPEQIGDLLALDRPQGCDLCHPGVTKVALRNLEILCQWWLSPELQERWKVGTVIQGNQSTIDDSDVPLPNMDALFKVQFNASGPQYPIFLVINQHHPEKKYPHYQLQVPTGDFLKSIKGHRSEAELRKLYAACEKATKELSYKKLKSASLHDPLAQSDLNLINRALSSFVEAIGRYLR